MSVSFTCITIELKKIKGKYINNPEIELLSPKHPSMIWLVGGTCYIYVS